MEITPNLLAKIYFENDGQFDLLTGAMAPNRLNQIIEREVNLSKRNSENLAIISVKLDLKTMKSVEINGVVLEIESALIQIHFQIKSLLREIDCIGRVSTNGFWIFIKLSTSIDSTIIIDRIKVLTPDNLIISVITHLKGESQLQWYERVDQEHFQ